MNKFFQLPAVTAIFGFLSLPLISYMIFGYNKYGINTIDSSSIKLIIAFAICFSQSIRIPNTRLSYTAFGLTMTLVLGLTMKYLFLPYFRVLMIAGYLSVALNLYALKDRRENSVMLTFLLLYAALRITFLFVYNESILRTVDHIMCLVIFLVGLYFSVKQFLPKESSEILDE